jgi:hypothetical protein
VVGGNPRFPLLLISEKDKVKIEKEKEEGGGRGEP